MKDHRFAPAKASIPAQSEPRLVVLGQPISDKNAGVPKRSFTPWHFAAIVAAIIASVLVVGFTILFALRKQAPTPDATGESKWPQSPGMEARKAERLKLKNSEEKQEQKPEKKELCTPEEKASIGHFWRAWRACCDKDSLVQQLMPKRMKEGVLVPTVEEQNQMDWFMTLALREARLVQPDLLAKAHPDLPRMFRAGFLRYLELDAMPQKNPNDYQECALALRLWYDWINVHQNDLRIPGDLRR